MFACFSSSGWISHLWLKAYVCCTLRMGGYTGVNYRQSCQTIGGVHSALKKFAPKVDCYTQSLIADSYSVVKPVVAFAISDIFLICANFFTDSVCVAMSICVRSLTCSFEKWRAFPSLRTSVSPTNRMELLTRKDMEPGVWPGVARASIFAPPAWTMSPFLSSV